VPLDSDAFLVASGSQFISQLSDHFAHHHQPLPVVSAKEGSCCLLVWLLHLYYCQTYNNIAKMDMPFFSSQGSQADSNHPIQLPGQENLASSPLRSRSDAAAALKSSSLKPKGAPTVTPKRFNKFFAPRATLSGRGGRQSKAGRQLRDITRNAVNRRKSAPLGIALGEEVDELVSSRPAKRRKQSFDMPSSPPQSSPLKRVEPVRDEIRIFEDDPMSQSAVDEEEDLPNLMEQLEPFPKPIRRLRQTGRTDRILQRSFGGYDTTSQGYRGTDHVADWRSETANFVSSPEDCYSFRGRALPFCSASCNTNPMVAFADEEGSVRLMDTTSGSDFQKPHVSFKVHRNAIMEISFSSDDYMLATASGDQNAHVVDMQTQQTMYILSGHNGSLKQVRFQPGDDKMLTTCSRDGSVQIWDLRCSSKTATQILRPAHRDTPDAQTLYSKYSIDMSPAHRVISGKPTTTLPMPGDINGISVTAFQHLSNGRGHMLATASEANASIKLWDLRNAGRRGIATPVSSTPVPEHHQRNFGVSALALSSDGARLYSVCRDSVVYAYATNHLITGCAPEMSASKAVRRAPKEGRMGVGPLYGYKHPNLRVASFYVRASMRVAKDDNTELLAIGSSDKCPVLIPTDERHLPFRNNRPQPDTEDDDSDSDSDIDLPTLSPPAPTPAPPKDTGGLPIYDNIGSALLHGHRKEVTSVCFSSEGNLVTIGDDYRARCWRENAREAKRLRNVGDFGGERWGAGWADVDAKWDESDVE